MSKNNLLLVAFFLFLFSVQANFFWTGASRVFYALGFVAALMGLASRAIRKDWFLYVLIFSLLFLLTALVPFFGQNGEMASRSLYFYSFTLVFMVLVASAVNENEENRSSALNLIHLSLWVEILVVLLQFSYLTWGVGLVPKTEFAENTKFITGSFGNPNNVAVVIVLYVLLLINKGSLVRRASTSILLALAAVAIFLTLSRTAFVVYATLLVYFFLKDRQGERLGKGLISGYFVLVLLAGVLFGAANSLKTSDSMVIERSLTRLETLSAVGEDESVAFRFISMTRLAQAIDRLGLGTMSDLNYRSFFDSSDLWLAQVNPHSFIVEMSFLFGYPGLVIALLLFVVMFIHLVRINKSLVLGSYIGAVFVLFQSVPSSVMAFPLFFLLMVMICLFGKVSDSNVDTRV